MIHTEVAQEEVIGVGAVATDTEQLFEVIELPVNITCERMCVCVCVCVCVLGHRSGREYHL
jgi:hypothetical protein